MAQIIDRLTAALADRYRIQREIGSGGMATVYLAEDLKHHRQVAVKVLRPDLAAALGSERFLREIEVAARLMHPHILPLHDSGEADGFLFYVMPYVAGESLRARLEREHELPIGEAVRILRDVVDALASAHRHGVVHRDIKPDNVLMSEGHALVTDFGVAKAVSEATGRGQITTAGVALGTPAYMAPEQASADPNIDQRVDIYAVGVMAYELLTGQPPFTGATAQAILSAQVMKAPEPITTHRQTVPPELEAIVMRCLEKKPADRWQNAEELLPSLEALTTSSGGITPTDTRPVTGISAAPIRSKGVLLGTGALVVAAAAAGGFLLFGGGEDLDLDANLLAIAPFDLVAGDERLEDWREGISDIVSRHLDGVGPLSTLSTTVAVNRWQGRAEPASAAALGRATGAGLVVFGTIVGSGPDSARVQATIYDVVAGRVVAETELRESRDRVDRLADSLSLRLANALSAERQFGNVRLSRLGSTSPAAVKAFLRGEQLFRHAVWDSAAAAYEEATGLDSTFALAWWRLGSARGWGAGGDSPGAYRRAGELNHGLPPRDSLLIRITTLYTLQGQYDSAWEANRSEYWRTVRGGVQRYPQEPWMWYALGEAQLHRGVGAEEHPDSAYVAFDRALALDSTMVEPLVHAVEAAMYRDGGIEASRYIEAALATSPGEDARAGWELTRAIVDSGLTGDVLTERLATMSTSAITRAHTNLTHWPGSADAVLAVAAERAERVGISFPLVGTLALRGRLREAAAASGSIWNGYQRAVASSWGALPSDTAQAIFDVALQQIEGNDSDADFLGWYAVLPWLAQQQDTVRLERGLEGIRSGWREAPDSIRRQFTQREGFAWSEAMVAGYLALARGDTAGALDALAQSRFHRFAPVFLNEYLTRARLLAATGRDSEALAILEHGGMGSGIPMAEQALWILERGRIHRRLGNRDEAIRDFSYVAAIWETADDVLQPLVQEARDAVAELTGER